MYRLRSQHIVVESYISSTYPRADMEKIEVMVLIGVGIAVIDTF
jgi:hypothetical protein